MEDQTLSLGDRKSDSGIQVHMSFPLYPTGTSSVAGNSQALRALTPCPLLPVGTTSPEVVHQVLALAVHVDDFLFLRNYPAHLSDDLNDVWTTALVNELFAAADKGHEVRPAPP